MSWIDIASIVFVCVTMNHLGLISAIEKNLGRGLLVLNCPKCSSFWFTFAYCSVCCHCLIMMLAISFLASYISIWLELFEGFIDTLYLKLYDKIYDTSADTTSSDPE
jgi:hypothetical protein